MARLTYRCDCGADFELHIIADEAPPIPYSAWPDDRWEDAPDWSGCATDPESPAECPSCTRPMPVLAYNVNRTYQTPKERRPLCPR